MMGWALGRNDKDQEESKSDQNPEQEKEEIQL